MITSIKIQNFRCFRSIEIDDLAKVNVLVGRNANGKTALLEAIYICSSSTAPQAAFQLRAMRRVGNRIEVSLEKAAYASLWDDLFYNFDTKEPVSISIRGDSRDSRSLKVNFAVGEQIVLPLDDQGRPSSPETQVVFGWQGAGQPIEIKPSLLTNGIAMGSASVEAFPVMFFSPSTPESPEENAKRYSGLSKSNLEQEVLTALKSEFDFVEGLSIEFNGGVPSIFVSIKHLSRKFPIGMVSDGVNKLLGLILGILSLESGTILIDQLEDGFYYDRLPGVWRLITSLCARRNIQLFVTTHSAECLQALLPCIDGHENDYRLIRMNKSGDHLDIDNIPGKRFKAALQQHFELR